MKKNPTEEDIKAKETENVPQINITMKEIANRIYAELKESLNLTIPKKGFFLNPEDRKVIDRPITRIPDKIQLTKKQISEINQKYPNSRSAHHRFVEVLKILMDNQERHEETFMDNPRSLGLRKTLEKVGTNMSLPLQIYADTEKLKKKLQGIGIINEYGHYGIAIRVINGEDADIIRYYCNIAHGLLSFYRCADNLGKIKT